MTKDTQYIGMAVNKLRKNGNMTLKELSDVTGLSQGFLSKFERGQTTIAVDSLMLIATALGTSIEGLLSQETDRSSKYVHHSFENTVMYMENNNHINYQISDNYVGMDFFPKLIVILPTATAEHDEAFSHVGQEFLYVLEGILTLEIDGEVHELYPGDTAHYKSNVMHTWYNKTNKTVKILTIHAPNIFNQEPQSPQ